MENLKDDLDFLKLYNDGFHKLDSLLESFYDINGTVIKNEHLNLIKRIKEVVDYTNPPPKSYFYNRELFRKDFNFPDNNYIHLVWDVKKVREIIKKYDLPIVPGNVENLQQFGHREHLDTNKLKVLAEEEIREPIILAEYTPLGEHFILDGNHRLYSRQDISSEIPMYYIESRILLMEGLAGLKFQLIYGLHENLSLLNQMLNPEELEKRLLKPKF